MPKSRKGHNGPKRPDGAYPTAEPVVTPWIAHLDANVRLDAMEEASRRAIAAGNPNYRVVTPRIPARISSIIPIPASGLILGPGGKPIGV